MMHFLARGVRCDLALAALSGLLIAASMPKLSMWILAWVALVPFFHAISDKRPIRSMFLGWIMGFFAYLGILYWVVHTQIVYGGVPTIIAVTSMVLLVVVCALYMALFGFFSALVTGSGAYWNLLIAAPFLWVTQEYILSMIPLGGFPWQLLGYSQAPFLPAIQIADITGVYGISFIIVMVNACLYRLLKRIPGFQREVFNVSIILAFCLGYGFYQLHNYNAKPTLSDQGVNTLIVQGNIDQSLKWDDRFLNETINIYRELSFKNGEKADLIIWPETAVPLYYQSNEKYRLVIQEVAKKTGAYLLFGSPSWNQKRTDVQYFNSAFILDPRGLTIGRYDKVHLVPYGEYIPLRKWISFLNPLVESLGDFTPGSRIAPLETGFGKIGVLICFESIFPPLSRRMVQQGSWLLVNLTNDAWHGRTSEPYQHLSMSQMRSVENRRPSARATNTGITAFIDEAGRLRKTLGLFRRGVLKQSIDSKQTSKSFYTLFGDVFAVFCIIFSAIMTLPIKRLSRLRNSFR